MVSFFLVHREMRLGHEHLVTDGASDGLVDWNVGDLGLAEGVDGLLRLRRRVVIQALLVRLELRLEDEALAADGALVGPAARVVPLVNDERGLLGEALAALLARVRLLARVAPHVRDEVAARAKGLAAHLADVGLLARVRPVVHLERAAARHGLAADVARVQLHARVVAHVQLEAALLHVRLAAQLALVLAHGRLVVGVVLLLVDGQPVLEHELHAAHLALVHDVQVGHLVLVQLLVGVAALVADVARQLVLVGVALLVDHQVGLLHARVAADAAHIRLLPEVDFPVHGELVVALESALTHVATIGPDIAMAHHVTPQTLLVGERQGTHFALVGPLPRVDHQVLRQVIQRERLSTKLARLSFHYHFAPFHFQLASAKKTDGVHQNLFSAWLLLAARAPRLHQPLAPFPDLPPHQPPPPQTQPAFPSLPTTPDDHSCSAPRHTAAACSEPFQPRATLSNPKPRARRELHPPRVSPTMRQGSCASVQRDFPTFSRPQTQNRASFVLFLTNDRAKITRV